MARKKNPEKRMGLGGHLRELRNRLFWSALFIIAGAVVGWIIFDQVFALLQAPIVKYAAEILVWIYNKYLSPIVSNDVKVIVNLF